MKKALMFLFFSISIANAQTSEKVYSDTKNSVKTVYEDLKSTTPHINNAIKALSKELKVTSDTLWHILVKQQLVWSFGLLVSTIASILNWFLFYKRNLGSSVKYEKCMVKVQKMMYPNGATDYEIREYPNTHKLRATMVEEEALVPIPTSTIPNFKYIHLMVCLILSFFSAFYFSDMLTGFINPEFGALKTIIEVVQSIKK